MRIIAGKYRGRVITAPKGMDTRPTTDRVRESLMSAIASNRGDFDELRVLDAFAGSGALGIECLSRGAAHVVFCEKSPQTAQIIRENLATLGVGRSEAQVLVGNTFVRVPQVSDVFDVVLLDPPYAFEASAIAGFLAELEQGGLLAEDALITYEHAKGSDISPLLTAGGIALEQVSTKTYGDICIEFLQRKSS